MYIVIALLVLLGICLVGIALGPRPTSYFNPFEKSIPTSEAKYFGCRKHGHKRLVSFYDPDNPPTCPTCGEILEKG